MFINCVEQQFLIKFQIHIKILFLKQFIQVSTIQTKPHKKSLTYQKLCCHKTNLTSFIIQDNCLTKCRCHQFYLTDATKTISSNFTVWYIRCKLNFDIQNTFCEQRNWLCMKNPQTLLSTSHYIYFCLKLNCMTKCLCHRLRMKFNLTTVLTHNSQFNIMSNLNFNPLFAIMLYSGLYALLG